MGSLEIDKKALVNYYLGSLRSAEQFETLIQLNSATTMEVFLGLPAAVMGRPITIQSVLITSPVRSVLPSERAFHRA